VSSWGGVGYGDPTTYIAICAFYSLFHGLFHSHMILYDYLYILHFICIFLHMLLIIYLHIFVVAVPVALSVYSCLHSHISPQFRVFSPSVFDSELQIECFSYYNNITVFDSELQICTALPVHQTHVQQDYIAVANHNPDRNHGVIR
jgi:hypothetical protein